jgi:hypothetical protein
MPEFMEARRQNRDREDEDQQSRAFKSVIGGVRQPFPEEHPPAHSDERNEDGHDHPRPEQESKRVSEPSSPVRFGDRIAKP